MGLIRSQLRDAASTASAGPCRAIVVVGGFAQQPFLQRWLTVEFEDEGVPVVFPEQPGLAVVEGSVLYGKQQEPLASNLLAVVWLLQRRKRSSQEECMMSWFCTRGVSSAQVCTRRRSRSAAPARPTASLVRGPRVTRTDRGELGLRAAWLVVSDAFLLFVHSFLLPLLRRTQARACSCAATRGPSW